MATQSTGFFTVPTGTAVIAVRLRIVLDNFGSESLGASVVVSKRTAESVVRIHAEELTVPPFERRVIDVEGVAGQDVEVTISMRDREYPSVSPLIPGVAVVSDFPPEQEVTLLGWVSAGDFATVPSACSASAR